MISIVRGLPGRTASSCPTGTRRARPTSGSSSRSPSASDLASARALNRELLAELAEKPDLPDRPLPRQRDGAEPDGAALRQHDLRAAVVAPAHRQRADHGRRGDRHRGARQASTRSGHHPRHRAEPRAAGALHHRHGAAHLLGRQRGPRREGQGAAHAPPHPLARTRSAASRCAASTRPGRCAATRCPATCSEPGVSPPVQGRDLRRHAPRGSTRGAGAACRSTCAPASAWPSAITEVAIQFKSLPHGLFLGSPAPTIEPNRWSCASSRTRASRSASPRRCPARASPCATSRWTSATGPSSDRARRRRTSGSSSTPCAATPPSSPARTRWRRSGLTSIPSARAGRPSRPPSSLYEAGSWGPPRPTRSWCRAATWRRP